MISRNYAAVVIPVHKPFTDLTAAEVLSLKSTCKCLREYPHVLIGPESINWNEYKASLHSYNVEDVSIKVFDKIFFTDIDGYSSLLKTFNFYKTFNGFKFILIFQLDAYILKNELDYWCSKGYDYIGAPWLDTTTEEIIGVGNGGFSLRKVDSAIRVTKRMIFLQRLRRFWYKSHFQAMISFPRVVSYFQKYLKIRNMEEVNIIHRASYPNEDHYWSILSNFFTDYNVAPNDDAMHFSFETNPSFLYKKNNYLLPFGYHGSFFLYQKIDLTIQ